MSSEVKHDPYTPPRADSDQAVARPEACSAAFRSVLVWGSVAGIPGVVLVLVGFGILDPNQSGIGFVELMGLWGLIASLLLAWGRTIWIWIVAWNVTWPRYAALWGALLVSLVAFIGFALVWAEAMSRSVC